MHDVNRMLGGTLNCFPTIVTTNFEKLAPLITRVTSVMKRVLSDFLPFGGLLVISALIGGAIGLISTFLEDYLDTRNARMQALSLIRDDMEESEKEEILKIIEWAQAEDREDLIEEALPLIRDDMTVKEILVILDAFRQILAEKRQDIILHATLLMRDDMTAKGKGAILNALRRTPAAERDKVLSDASRLMRADMTGEGKGAILYAIGMTPAADRDDVLSHASRFINDDMTGEGKGRIIDEIRKTEPNEREDVVSRVLLLTNDNTTELGKYRLLHEIRTIEAVDRDATIESSLPFMKDPTGEEKAHALHSVKSLPVEARKDILQLAEPLMRGSIYMLEHGGRLFLTILQIPSLERSDRARRALDQLHVDFPEESPVPHGYLNRVRELLETPLDQPILPLRGGMVLAAEMGLQEINAHAGKRDSQTKNALVLLVSGKGTTSFSS